MRFKDHVGPSRIIRGVKDWKLWGPAQFVTTNANLTILRLNQIASAWGISPQLGFTMNYHLRAQRYAAFIDERSNTTFMLCSC
jgi:hypothetical protein